MYNNLPEELCKFVNPLFGDRTMIRRTDDEQSNTNRTTFTVQSQVRIIYTRAQLQLHPPFKHGNVVVLFPLHIDC